MDYNNINSLEKKSINIDNSPKDFRYNLLRDYVAEFYPNPPPPGFPHPPIPTIVKMHHTDNIPKIDEIHNFDEKYEILLSETKFTAIVEYEEVEEIKILDENIGNSDLSSPECDVNLIIINLDKNEEITDLNKIEIYENGECKDEKISDLQKVEICENEENSDFQKAEIRKNEKCGDLQKLEIYKQEETSDLYKEISEQITKNSYTVTEPHTVSKLQIISEENQKEIDKDFQVIEDESWNIIDKNLEKLEEITTSLPNPQYVEKHSPLNYPNPAPQGFEYPTKPNIIYKEDIKDSNCTTLNVTTTNLDEKLENNNENNIENNPKSKIILLPPEIDPRSPVILMQPSLLYGKQLHRIEEEIEPGSTFSTFKGGEIEEFEIGEKKKKCCCGIFCC